MFHLLENKKQLYVVYWIDADREPSTSAGLTIVTRITLVEEVSGSVIENTRRQTSNALVQLDITPRDWMLRMLNKIGVWKKFTSVFRRYPDIWYDLLIIFHRNQWLYDEYWKLINPSSQWVQHCIEELYPFFFRYNSEHPEDFVTKDDIVGLINNTKIANKARENSKTQRSIIWTPNSKIRGMSIHWIQSLIYDVIRRNTWYNDREIESSFPKIARTVSYWMMDIFGVNLKIESFNGIHDFSEKLMERLARWGLESEVAAEFIRCLYAWSDIETVEIIHWQAEGFSRNFVTILGSVGIYQSWNTTSNTKWENTVFSWTFQMPIWNTAVDFKMSWRVKSIRSMLLKLRCDKNYGRAELLRDAFWATTIPNGTISDYQREKLLQRLLTIPENNAYIVRNRNTVNVGELSKILGGLSPAVISSTWKDRTNWVFRNISISGFTRKTSRSWKKWTAIWYEMQYFENEWDAHPKWFTSHYVLDASKVLEWWIEGAKMITKLQIYEVFNKNIPDDIREENKIPEKNSDILSYYINTGLLIPETLESEWNKIAVYIWKWKKRAFKKEFSGIGKRN